MARPESKSLPPITIVELEFPGSPVPRPSNVPVPPMSIVVTPLFPPPPPPPPPPGRGAEHVRPADDDRGAGASDPLVERLSKVPIPPMSIVATSPLLGTDPKMSVPPMTIVSAGSTGLENGLGEDRRVEGHGWNRHLLGGLVDGVRSRLWDVERHRDVPLTGTSTAESPMSEHSQLSVPSWIQPVSVWV